MNLNSNNNQEIRENYIKLDMRKVDISVYMPKLLITRLVRREKLQNFSVMFFLYNIILLGLSITYLDSSSMTRRYISNGDDFWGFILENKLKPKEISLFFAFTGLLILFSSCFNIMNGIVILKHIFRGGLKIRLSFAIYTTLIIQIIDFCFSIYVILKYNSILFLNLFLIILSGLHFLITVLFFFLTRKIINKESDYMLPLKTLLKHKEDYFEEYEKKLNT